MHHPDRDSHAEHPALSARSPRLGLGLVLGLGSLVLLSWVSLGVGAAGWQGGTIQDLWAHGTAYLIGHLGSGSHSIGHHSNDIANVIVWQVRWPRTLAAIATGAALAVAGALMQGLTRNPLADPGLLGINSGAALAVVAAVFLGHQSSLSQYSLWAMAGAAIAALTIARVASLGWGGLNPLNLTLAGAALTAVFSALTTGILILSQRTLDDIRFWLAGSLIDRTLPLVWQGLIPMAIGLGLALGLGRGLTLLSLGETVAQGLGQRPERIKAWGLLSTVLLAGGAVSVVGQLGFVGLVVPHGVRRLVGQDYRWVIPYSAMGGALLVLGLDVAIRWVWPTQALPVGLILPIVGTPVFLYWVVRRT